MISTTQHLLAEKQTVENLLAQTPPDDVLEWNSFAARLDVLNSQIAQVASLKIPARSIITYRGRPVFGSHGVASAFGLQATRAYTKLVQNIAAQWHRNQPLGARGTVPDSQKFDLLIVGTALGSFGFEVEERIEEQLSLEEQSVLARSLSKTHQLLQSTLGTDDELTEAITDLDPRVLSALRAFLEVLQKNDAVCAIESDAGRFHFDSSAQVTQSARRLQGANIHREETELVGAFEGVLPTPRTFEFRQENGSVVFGKIGPQVADIALINTKTGVPTRVKATSHRVGEGKPRYVVNETPRWPDETP